MKDSYRWTSKVYDVVIGPMNAGLWSIALAMSEVHPGMEVLDVGCGTGTLVGLYAAEGCHAFGIDLSPAMVARARRRLGDRADLREGDATDMPYADQSFDLVVAAMFLHELDAAVCAGVLDEIRRVLRADGRLLVVDFGPRGPQTARGRALRAMSTVIEAAAGREHFRHFREYLDAGAIPGLFAGSGFAMERERLVGDGNMALSVLRPA